MGKHALCGETSTASSGENVEALHNKPSLEASELENQLDQTKDEIYLYFIGSRFKKYLLITEFFRSALGFINI